MLYLLDADVLIRADRFFYPLNRFPIFWRWLVSVGQAGTVKIPQEQYEEVVAGKGRLVDWLKDKDVKQALLFDEEAVPETVNEVTVLGYGELDDNEIIKLGRDPFLISYAYIDPENRRVVTLEVSSPRKQGANRKVPDVCEDLGIQSHDLFELIEILNFSTDWTAPADQ